MTVLTAIKQACTVMGLDVPTSVFGSTAREHIELAALTLEVAERIKEDHDWNELKVVKKIVGDSTAGDFALPSDYSRMLKEGALWSDARPSVPLTHIQDSETWLASMVAHSIPANPQWTIYGGMLRIDPIIPIGENVSFFYIKKLPEIALDTDTFSISERLLKLGIIWQWKAHKSQPYAEDMQNYEIAFKNAVEIDVGPSAFAVGLDNYRPNNNFVTIKEFTP
jgi:hypothetical protein